MKILPFVSLLLFLSCGQQQNIDPLLRSHVDGLNKEAFVSRYRCPDSCIALSSMALQLVADSLPDYTDGILRARNNMAFAYYQKSDAESAHRMLDHVENLLSDHRRTARNADIEWVIAQLLRARLLQRNCQIADSYRLLYDIGQSGKMKGHKDNLLYAYALSEYYITTLVLNYHYRGGKEADVRSLLAEVEHMRDNLRVDYAEDMALNYALAYGWQSAGESLRALDYCEQNYFILDLPSAFCTYHYANTVQMEALALKSIPGRTPPDSVLALYEEARRSFFDYADPYQMLGGTTSTARYALLCGDTAMAHSVLSEWMQWVRSVSKDAHASSTWQPFSAPKLELSLFDVLLRSRMASSSDEALRWYSRHAELQEYIAANEKEDFVLQRSLADATLRSRQTFRVALLFAVMVLLLTAAAVLLLINTHRLRREKLQLQKAKQRDVERIANVETTLSVLRHDVSPFMSYLRSPNLSDELRSEVTEQLLRTFENIKNWTRLSIPGGMAFNATVFPVQEVFEEVRQQVLTPAQGVELRFSQTDLRLHADRLLIIILLRNLVNNALRYTLQGSVVVSAQAEGPMVHLSVADTGCGMSPEQVDALFRADRSLPEGSEHGFGLILCRYIVKKHDDNTRRGCKLWAESTPFVGSTLHCLVEGA